MSIVTAADPRATILKNAANPSMASSPFDAVTSRPANAATPYRLAATVARDTPSSTSSRRGVTTDSRRTTRAPPVSTSSGRM